jgi:iron complex outermembrane recepter protein
MFGSVRSWFIVLTATLIVGPISASLIAQTNEANRGQLIATITDSTGAAVGDALVTLTRGGERRTMTTGNDGVVRFTGLGAGKWTITVTREGFARWTKDVNMTSGSIDVPVNLSVAGFAETVQVESVAGPTTQVPLNATATGGSRLDIPVRDLPASLFLVGQSLIQERGARSVEEAVQLAVGMQASTGVGSIPSYATRGWSGNDVSLMRDGIRQNSASQSSRPVDAFLLDRIEILKGPASLLYGEGALAGAVNLVSKSPISQPNLASLLAYGSYGQYRTGVGINVPLRSNLFARVDASQSGSDGYVRRSPQKLVATATSLRWLPTSNISLKATGTYTYDNTSPQYYSTPFINGQIDPRTRDINYNMADALAKSHNRWLQLDADALFRSGWRFHNQLFVATHTLDWRNFEGYTYNATTRTVDVSSYFLIWRNDLLVGDRGDIRNTFKVGGRDLTFMVGAEAQRNDLERAGNPTPNYVVPVRKLDPFNPTPHVDPGFVYVRQRDVLINTAALFAESVFTATERLKVVTGIRWEQIGLEYTPYPSRVTASQDYRPLTGRVGAIFAMAPSANVYASYSRAVQPTTQLVSLDGSQQQFSLVPGSQLEVGTKGGAFRGRLEGTFAYFAIAKQDLLITQLIDGIQTAQQVGEQTSNGIELALVARPTRTLTLAGDVAYTTANFVDFVEIVGGVNTVRSGNTPPNVPRTIWNFSPTQRVGPVDLTATIRQVGSRWGDNGNTRLVSGFTTVDAAVGYRIGGATRITVRGRNLTDQIYTQSVSNTAGRLEPPRAVDVTFTTDLNLKR